MTQQSHSQAYTQRKPKLKKTHVSHCSLQHYLQQLEHGSNLDVQQQIMDKEVVVQIYDGILLSHKRECSCTDGGNVNWYSHYGRRYGDSLKSRNKTAIWPSILTLGTYPEETKLEKDICIPLFIAALFTTARTWKQPRCPLTDEWIKKLWYIYTMENCSAIKRNTFESVLMRWLNLEPIIQSEMS